MTFDDSYPTNPPKCHLDPPFSHPNVSDNGLVSMKMLEMGWQPTITIKTLLIELKKIFDDPQFFQLYTYAHFFKQVEESRTRAQDRGQLESCDFTDLAM